MSIEVHRAGRTYYPHSTVLLNVPRSELDGFFALQDWPTLASAKYLRIPEVGDRPLTSFGGAPAAGTDPGLSAEDLDSIMKLAPEEAMKEMERLRADRRRQFEASSPSGIIEAIEHRSGVPREVWQVAGRQLLDAVIPDSATTAVDLPMPLGATAEAAGLGTVKLISDFPLVTATYGFSREGYRPSDCHLRPFPPSPEHGNRIPIYVDLVQADALLLSLDPRRVIRWLRANHYGAITPQGSDAAIAERAYFASLLHDAPLRQTLDAQRAEARMVFGLLHTLSHAAVRQASLLCGLDATSLSEYLIPSALSFALYCNHRSGATIGALTALFEQTPQEWLTAIRETSRCVYDPDCREHGASCHVCTQQAENTCRFFNLNLSRSFLFGGPDTELGQVQVGFLNPSLASP